MGAGSLVVVFMVWMVLVWMVLVFVVSVCTRVCSCVFRCVRSRVHGCLYVCCIVR